MDREPFWKHLSFRSLPPPPGGLPGVLAAPPLSAGAPPIPHPPPALQDPCGPQGGSLAGAGRGSLTTVPPAPALSDPGETQVRLLQQLGGWGHAGECPQGPLWLGPVLDLARPTTARFNPPSGPQVLTQTRRAFLLPLPTQAGPCTPGLPHTPWLLIAAAHRRAQLPLPGSLALWGRALPPAL